MLDPSIVRRSMKFSRKTENTSPPPFSPAGINSSRIGRYKPQHSKTLNSVQEQVILGGLLGDFCLWRGNTARNAFLIANHSYKQAAYIQYKYSILKDLVRSPPRIINNAGGGRRDGSRSPPIHPTHKPLQP